MFGGVFLCGAWCGVKILVGENMNGVEVGAQKNQKGGFMGINVLVGKWCRISLQSSTSIFPCGVRTLFAIEVVIDPPKLL